MRQTAAYELVGVDVCRPSAVRDHGGAAGGHRLHGEERSLQEVQAGRPSPQQCQTLVSTTK